MEGSARSPVSLQQCCSPELLSTQPLVLPTATGRASGGSKRKSLTVTTTGDCCLQGNPNGPKHPEMLGEGVTCKNSHRLKMLGKSALPSGDGKPKDACNEGFLLSRPVTCMGKAPLGKLQHDPELLHRGYVPSKLLLTPALVCLRAFHQNITTKQRKY